jgi:hypothetical protein
MTAKNKPYELQTSAIVQAASDICHTNMWNILPKILVVSVNKTNISPEYEGNEDISGKVQCQHNNSRSLLVNENILLA